MVYCMTIALILTSTRRGGEGAADCGLHIALILSVNCIDEQQRFNEVQKLHQRRRNVTPTQPEKGLSRSRYKWRVAHDKPRRRAVTHHGPKPES